MSGNRSLDEFVGAGADDSADGEQASGDDRADAHDVEANESDPAPTDVGDPGGGEAGDDGAAVDSGDDGAAVDSGDDGAAVDSGDDDAAVDHDDTDVYSGAGSDDASGDVDADDGGPEPQASTYVWRPGGGTCAVCDEPVDERWRDGEGLVCAGCKEW